jgi:hypothetical protein
VRPGIYHPSRRQAGEMIAVKMRNQNEVNIIARDTLPL